MSQLTGKLLTAGLAMKDLSLAAVLERGTVRRVEHGYCRPRSGTLEKLACVLGAL
jgi:hypothetical protein